MREANNADAADIAGVQVAAWKLAYRGMVPDSVLDAMTVDDRTARWRTILGENPRATLVASLSGRVIGWSGFGPSRDSDRDDGFAEIYGLYVHPDNWRSGVGRMLWSATAERLCLDGYCAADVWVLEANDRARRFYESVGCSLDTGASKMFEGDGYALPEARYSLEL